MVITQNARQGASKTAEEKAGRVSHKRREEVFGGIVMPFQVWTPLCFKKGSYYSTVQKT